MTVSPPNVSRNLALIGIVLLTSSSACVPDDSRAEDSGIIDIGKTCSQASDCDNYCVVSSSESVGQCSLECSDNSDCPSFMDCIESSSTGDTRCFDPGGFVAGTLPRLCEFQCADVAYFCTTDEVTAEQAQACQRWCYQAIDEELEAFIDCVDAEERYTDSCPAAHCVSDRFPST